MRARTATETLAQYHANLKAEKKAVRRHLSGKYITGKYAKWAASDAVADMKQALPRPGFLPRNIF